MTFLCLKDFCGVVQYFQWISQSLHLQKLGECEVFNDLISIYIVLSCAREAGSPAKAPPPIWASPGKPKAISGPIRQTKGALSLFHDNMNHAIESIVLNTYPGEAWHITFYVIDIW